MIRRLVLLLSVLVLVPIWISLITNRPIAGDPVAYVAMAHNLVARGVISDSESAPFEPSMYREPLPVITTASAILIANWIVGPGEHLDDYLSGARARIIKMQNVFWLLALCAAGFWAAWSLTGSFRVSYLAAFAAQTPFLLRGFIPGAELDTLATELTAAALLILGSAAIFVAANSGRRSHVVLAGAAFALLAMTKAVFLYVFIGTVLALAMWLVIKPWRAHLQLGAVSLAILVGAFVLVVAPWVTRNWVQFHEIAVTQRGGLVLYTRAIKNLMTPIEYRGSFYVWGPKPLRPLIGKALGFSPADLQRGGRLQRLNRDSTSDFGEADRQCPALGTPEKCIAYYFKSRAERVRVRRELRAAGVSRPDWEADKKLQQMAMELIVENPDRHLAAIVPFVWRGAFLPLPLLLGALVLALAARRFSVVLFILPALGAIAFYALFSHFIMRYSAPTLPLALVAAVAVAYLAVRRREPPAAQK